MNQLVLSLPCELLRYKLFPLLSLDDIVHFDTSIASKTRRAWFHTQLCNISVFTNSQSVLTLSAFRWLNKHKLICKNVKPWPKITNEDVAEVTKLIPMQHVTHLDFQNCERLSSESMQTMVKLCSCLQFLNVAYCPKMDANSALLSVIQHCPALTGLDLSGFANLDDQALLTIAKQCTGLQTLSLSNCYELTDASLITLSVYCTQLQKLNIQCLESVTDAAVIALIWQCKGLKALDLYDCSQLTQLSLLALVQNCSALEELRLGSPPFNEGVLSTATLLSLAHYCCLHGGNLRRLNLHDCEHVTNEVLAAFARSNYKLQIVDVGSCCLLTDDAVVILSENCPLLCKVK